jgi:hypothetical protein
MRRGGFVAVTGVAEGPGGRSAVLGATVPCMCGEGNASVRSCRIIVTGPIRGGDGPKRAVPSRMPPCYAGFHSWMFHMGPAWLLPLATIPSSALFR